MTPNIILNDEPLVDLRKYDQSNFDRGRPNWIIILWWLVQAIAFPLSLHNFNSFRCWLLRLFGAKIGEGVVIRPTARFTYPWKVSIGDYSWIGDDVVLYSIDNIEIGSHCVVSQKTYLCTASHDMQDRAFSLITAPIKIGNGAWVATDCFVAPGVNIGSNAVIGAKSGVFRDIPHSKLAWGIPCTVRDNRTMKS
ncbi:MAG: hormogonium polysaccharide biosynthesis acetyltransferase HpsU [Xenococcaceae cyanobacterium MO_207.B15]|nr:hormogonium polysaccharide biosynthesis acetyltransferase HpsU [Xenococcaceae cyanobacterium MO_207.B15]MDJ0744186.1 hormogonium polysaccharide biosynthesis acetyltransferase HpsU [Xenococcaceae cyanobacterium MO_167.B27]